MAPPPIVLLLLSLAAAAWFTWRDIREYAAFKALTETTERQRFYRRWLITAFALFFAGSLAVLAALGRLDAALSQPPQIAALSAEVRKAVPIGAVGPELLGGMVAGMAISVVAVVIVASRRGGTAPAAVELGDIGALMPRNGPETLWTLLLSLNAGIGEELFFRLVLPLLFILVTGNAVAGFVAAGLVFGAAHLYQGWTGLAATTLAAVVFTGLYLATGSLIAPIALHVLVDVLGLVVRPTAARMLARRR